MAMYTAMPSFMSLIENDPRKDWMLIAQKRYNDPTLTDYGIVKEYRETKKKNLLPYV